MVLRRLWYVYVMYVSDRSKQWAPNGTRLESKSMLTVDLQLFFAERFLNATWRVQR